MNRKGKNISGITIIKLVVLTVAVVFGSCSHDSSDGDNVVPLWTASGADLTAFNSVGDSANPNATVGAMSLADLSIATMRAETFGGNSIVLGQQLGRAGGSNAYQLDNGSPADSYNTYMAAYDSDGLRVYARIDIPVTPMPAGGYPVVIFGHGWVGNKAAYTFNYTENGWYAPITDAYVDAGFVLVFPGFRAHGTVNSVVAEGQEFIDAYDNGSYLSPIFYARDLLHLIEDLDSLNAVEWSKVGGGYTADTDVRVDLSRIHLVGHSNAGDAILTALAVSGEGSTIENAITSADIWSGCFPTRYGQVEAYYPMQTSSEAFQAGTGSLVWNATDTPTAGGAANPNFVHGWPADWMANSTTETDINNEFAAWKSGWQNGYINKTVKEALTIKYGQMVTTLNGHVEGETGITVGNTGTETIAITDGAVIGDLTTVVVTIDPTLKAKLDAVSAVNYPEYLLDEKILFQFSDRDYYSWPELNEGLRNEINDLGGNAHSVKYAGHTHELKLSTRAWYRNAGAVVSTSLFPTADLNGYTTAIDRGVTLADTGVFPASDTFQ